MKPASKLCLIAASLLMLGTGTAMAGTVAPIKANNVVLVHGSWADGSSWSEVITRLQATGLHVTAVQNPLTSAAEDVAATNRVLDQQDGPTVLVGHSYAGVNPEPRITNLSSSCWWAVRDGWLPCTHCHDVTANPFREIPS